MAKDNYYHLTPIVTQKQHSQERWKHDLTPYYLLSHLSACAVIWRLQASHQSCVQGLDTNRCPSPFSVLTRGSTPRGKMDQASLRGTSVRASLTTPVLPCVSRSRERLPLSPGAGPGGETIGCPLSLLRLSRLPSAATRCTPLCPFVSAPFVMTLMPDLLREDPLRLPVLRFV